MSTFKSLVVFYAVGLITKIVQKLTVLKIADNVSLNKIQLAIEILGVLIGFFYWSTFTNQEVNTLLSSHCKTAMELTSDQSYQMDKVYTLLLSPEN
jgi:vancomycin permeability regulator SanA